MSVIETLSAGYAAIAKRPLAILLPVLVDVFLWLGPSLSVAPVLDRALQTHLVIRTAGDISTQFQELAERAGTINAFVLLAWQMPSIIVAHAADPVAGFERGGLAISSGGVVIATVLGLLVAGLQLAGIYLAAVAEVVDRTADSVTSYLGRLVRNLGRLLVFDGLIAGLVLLAGLPVMMVLAMIAQASPEAASFVGTLLAVVVVWAWLYVFFAMAAIFLRDRGPVDAIRESIALVSRHFWPALGLFLLVQIISLGTTIAWMPVMAHPAGVLAAIVGNGFISTGLAAAWMIFYQERTGTLAAVAAEHASASNRRR